MSFQCRLSTFLAVRSRSNRDALVAAYWYLCERGSKKFWRAGIDRADLEQVAAIGLIKAVEHYDPAFTTPFEAYAWLLIVGELMHYVRDQERIMRVPRTLRSLEKAYLATIETLSGRLNRAPRAAEIAAEMRCDVSTVDELRLIRNGGNVVSIEAATGSPTGDLPSRRREISLEERVTLHMALEELDERDRTIVLGTYVCGLSQIELGRRLGLSQSQVSKLTKKALDRLQRRVA